MVQAWASLQNVHCPSGPGSNSGDQSFHISNSETRSTIIGPGRHLYSVIPYLSSRCTLKHYNTVTVHKYMHNTAYGDTSYTVKFHGRSAVRTGLLRRTWAMPGWSSVTSRLRPARNQPFTTLSPVSKKSFHTTNINTHKNIHTNKTSNKNTTVFATVSAI